ncbi:Aste57867_25034 [Aphanomyces stellatus]|uniref:Aste57867_25034 protein n=1 Tax=Aphanomyces stellatus TaxID=120398 RepID=A0A485LS26_9STRA|nr:hypothetical protein As57867_024956 [Aphanomyces stellatus]VFU01665.1 Aste57867_25034 [Aphanomyces stellatus]
MRLPLAAWIMAAAAAFLLQDVAGDTTVPLTPSGDVVGLPEISLSTFDACTSNGTTVVAPPTLPPATYNISIELGQPYLSFNTLSPQTFLTILGMFTQLPQSSIAIANVRTNATKPTKFASIVLDVVFSLNAAWSCNSGTMSMGNLYGDGTPATVLPLCLQAFPCSPNCSAQLLTPFDVQRQAIWTALTAPTSIPAVGSSSPVLFATSRQLFNAGAPLAPFSPMTVSETPSPVYELVVDPYVTLRVAVTSPLPINGPTKLQLKYALVGALAARSWMVSMQDIAIRQIMALPYRTYLQANAYLILVDIGDAYALARDAVTEIFREDFYTWRQAIQSNVPTLRVLAMAMDDVNTYAAVSTMGQVPPSSFLNVKLGCTVPTSDVQRAIPILYNAIKTAITIMNLPPNGLQFNDFYGTAPFISPIDGMVPTLSSVQLQLMGSPTIDVTSATFLRYIQLGLIDSPLYCSTPPKLAYVTTPPVPYVAIVFCEWSFVMYDAFLPHLTKQAFVATIAPLGIKASDIVTVPQLIYGPTGVRVNFYMTKATAAQLAGLSLYIPSSTAWTTQVNASVLTNVNNTVLIGVSVQPGWPTISNPTYPGVAADTIAYGCGTLQTVTFVRPPKKYQYLSLTYPSGNLWAYAPYVQLTITSTFSLDAIYLDHMTMRSPVTMLNNPSLVAPIVGGNGQTTYWTFYSTPTNKPINTVQFCLHLKQVYKSARHAPLIVCIESLPTKGTQVTVEQIDPTKITATYQINSPTNNIQLTIQDPSTPSYHNPYTTCAQCQSYFQTCRNSATCREQVMGCLQRTKQFTFNGVTYGWETALFEAMVASGPNFTSPIDAMGGFNSCFQSSTAAMNYSKAIYRAWGVYTQGLVCANYQCPLGPQKIPITAPLEPFLNYYGYYVYDTMPGGTVWPVTLTYTRGNLVATFPNYSPTTSAAQLQSFIQSTFYSNIDPSIAPVVYAQQSVIQYVNVHAFVEPLPTLTTWTRSVGSPQMFVYPSNYFPLDYQSQQYPMSFNFMTSYGYGCPKLNWKNPIQFSPSMTYPGFLNLTLEMQVDAFLRAFFYDELSTCLGSIPASTMETEIIGVFQDSHCANFLAFDWNSVQWNTTTSTQDMYNTTLCPLVATQGKYCLQNVLLPALDRMMLQSGGCCDPFLQKVAQDFNSTPRRFIMTAFNLLFDTACATTFCQGVAQTCGFSALRNLTSPWIENVLTLFQLNNSQACAALAGGAITTLTNQTRAVYNKTCPLGGCGQYWDALFTWVASLPITSSYPTVGFQLSDLFTKSVDGPKLMGFWDSLMVRWHATGLKWPILDAWTVLFYSNVDYIYTNWLNGRRYHVSTGFSSQCNASNTTMAASGWICIPPPPVTIPGSTLPVVSPGYYLVRQTPTLQCVASTSSAGDCAYFQALDLCNGAQVLPSTRLVSCDAPSLANASLWCGNTLLLLASSWQCITSSAASLPVVAIRLNSSTMDVECMRSSDGQGDCLAFTSTMACQIQLGLPNATLQSALACGNDYAALTGHQGYFEPGHWCTIGMQLFNLTYSNAWPLWRCTPQTASTSRTPCRLNSNSDVECWAADHHSVKALSSLAACTSAIPPFAALLSPLLPLSCGRMHMSAYDSAAYSSPTHWCTYIRTLWNITLTPSPYVCTAVSNPPFAVIAARRNENRDVQCYAVNGTCVTFPSLNACQNTSIDATQSPVTCSDYTNRSNWCYVAAIAIDARNSAGLVQPVGTLNATRLFPLHDANDLTDWATSAFPYGWYGSVFWRFDGSMYRGSIASNNTGNATSPPTFNNGSTANLTTNGTTNAYPNQAMIVAPSSDDFVVPSSANWGFEKTRCILNIPSVGNLFCRGIGSDEWNAVMSCITFNPTTGAITNTTAFSGQLGQWYQYIF